jgi:hypothetical protein
MMANKIFAPIEHVDSRTYHFLRVGLALLCWVELGSQHRLFDSLPLWAIVCFWCSTSSTLFGWRPQLASLFTALYLGVLLHWFEGFASHRLTLLFQSTLILSLAPQSESLSPSWPLSLLRLQLSVVYAFGALDKMSGAFLSGERLDQILCAQYPENPLLSSDSWLVWMMPVIAISTVLFEWILAIGLWFDRVARLLLPAALLFHLSLYLVLPVYTFSALSALLWLSLVPSGYFSDGPPGQDLSQPLSKTLG